MRKEPVKENSGWNKDNIFTIKGQLDCDLPLIDSCSCYVTNWNQFILGFDFPEVVLQMGPLSQLFKVPLVLVCLDPGMEYGAGEKDTSGHSNVHFGDLKWYNK